MDKKYISYKESQEIIESKEWLVKYHGKEVSNNAVFIDANTDFKGLQSALMNPLLTVNDVVTGVFEKVKVHHLKIEQQYFVDVINRLKTFEIRKNDRNYQIGDVLRLNVIDGNGNFIKRPDYECLVEVVYTTDYEQKDDYVVMGIRLIDPTLDFA